MTFVVMLKRLILTPVYNKYVRGPKKNRQMPKYYISGVTGYGQL